MRLCGFTLKKKEASTGGGLGDKNWSSRMRFRGFDHHNGSLWFFRDYDEEEFRWKSRSRLFVVFCVGVSLVWEEHPMLTNYELTVEFDHRRKRYQRFFFLSIIFYKNTHRSKMEIPVFFFFYVVSFRLPCCARLNHAK